MTEKAMNDYAEGASPGAVWIRGADGRVLWTDDAVASLAHEIKNPLAAMRFALGLLAEDSGADDDTRRRVHQALDRSARRLSRLVEGVLDVSRSHAGALHASRAPVNVHALVERVVDDFRAMHPAARADVECVIAPDVTNAFLDRDRVEQVLLNLLGNAIRFTPDDGVVTVRIARAAVDALDEQRRLYPWAVLGAPALLTIDVEDTGIGMSQSTLAHLFERYHATGDERGGAHIGLWITRSLVEAHDGWLTIESRLGEGTTVRVCVPEDATTARTLAALAAVTRDAARVLGEGGDAVFAMVRRDVSCPWEETVRGVSRGGRPDAGGDAGPDVHIVNDRIALLLLCGAHAAAGPGPVLGPRFARVGEGAGKTGNLSVGWCSVRECVSVAQALHRAAARMIRAEEGSGSGETTEIASQTATLVSGS